jgi:hypothetical protein
MTSTMPVARMRILVVCLVVSMVSFARPLHAQDEPPPRIPLFAVDLHGIVPRFPSEDPQLALSRGMTLAELPGSGLGVQVSAHVYPLRVRAVTFGFGGELSTSRARQTPLQGLVNVRPAEERFTSFAPQLSFNFGTGRGWSYLSGGMGQSTWSLAPEGLTAYLPNSDKLKTINYGGGARWFMKPHLAFSFDVRFYAINPGLVDLYPATPRTSLLIIGAGVSIK